MADIIHVSFFVLEHQVMKKNGMLPMIAAFILIQATGHRNMNLNIAQRVSAAII